jgi:hypothetical protein
LPYAAPSDGKEAAKPWGVDAAEVLRVQYLALSLDALLE